MGESGRVFQLPRELHRAVGVPRGSLGMTQHPCYDRTERMSAHGRIVSDVMEGMMSMPLLVIQGEALLDVLIGGGKVAA